ncbi:hypothetical protein [Wolbachia endosymbiont of Rhagoletis cerasi]|nr:hypothetical protein [Wolbachia endosymbiont of Rhagoletis cerasi]
MGCHPSSLTTWIQKKEWCHESSLLLLSSQRPEVSSFFLDSRLE